MLSPVCQSQVQWLPALSNPAARPEGERESERNSKTSQDDYIQGTRQHSPAYCILLGTDLADDFYRKLRVCRANYQISACAHTKQLLSHLQRCTSASAPCLVSHSLFKSHPSIRLAFTAAAKGEAAKYAEITGEKG